MSNTTIKGPRINDQITAKEIRLIDENGEMVGIVPVKQGLEAAERAGLDLIEISPNAEPPVCKVLDFGKYKYEMQKKEAAAKKKQKVIATKELKIRPNIEEHDLQVKVKQARKFLSDGDKVRFSMMFRGRENEYKHIGMKVVEKVKEDLSDVSKAESGPKLDGNQIIMILVSADATE